MISWPKIRDGDCNILIGLQRMIMICIIGPFIPGKENITTLCTENKTYKGTFSEQRGVQRSLTVRWEMVRKRRRVLEKRPEP